MMIKSLLFVVLALLLLFSTQIFAFHPETANNLETPLTHWDQTAVWKMDGANRVVDTRDGRIQSVSQLREGPYQGSPEQAAREFLSAHKAWVGLDPTEQNLKVMRVAKTPMGNHVTFERVLNGVAVYPGNLVVTLSEDNYVLFYFSSLYLFNDNVNTSSAISADRVKQIAQDYLHPSGKPTFTSEPDLVIWAGDNRDFAACWRYHVNYTEPYGDWEVLVDATSSQIRRVKNIAVAVNGTAMVFDPDPLGSSGATYGQVGYTDNGNADSPQLTAQRFSRTLLDIQDLFLFGNHYYYLSGPYVSITDIESPNVAPVSQVNSTFFNYTRSATAFEDCQAYYDVDQSQRWIQSLGYSGIQNNSMQVDPHAENYGCNAHYHPSGNYLTFGEGNPDVDGAEEAAIILHEYGHGINNSIVPGWSGGDEGSMGEGWGDYWGESYAKSVAAFPDDWIGNWGLHNCFGGRTLHANLHYPEDNNIEVHYSGQIWSQALYEAETNMNNRVVMNKLGLQHQYSLGTGASMLTAAQAVVTADINLYGGLHLYAISDAFVPRGLLARPGNDGCGGYIISNLPYTDSGSTATADNDHVNCIGPTSPDVFYTLAQRDCPTNITVSLCGSSYDTGLEITTGPTCPGTSVVCNDDFCGSPIRQSQVTFTAAANQLYYIIIHGYLTYAGSYSLNVSGTLVDPPPVNDNCAGSIAFSSLPYSTSGTTCGGDHSFTGCGSNLAPDVFYNMTLASCQTVTISLCGSDYDTHIEARRGATCPGDVLVACNDDYCGLQSTVSFVAEAGVNYTIIVSGFSSRSGSYVMNVTGVPFVSSNDLCPGTTIASLPYIDNGSTICANNNYPHQIYGTSPDVVYSYTPATCQMVTASLCNSNFDTGLEIRKGGSCPGDVLVGYNDDLCAFLGGSEVTFYAAAGVNYYILVYGYGTSAGDYQLNMTGTAAIAPNDVCSGATLIGSLPFDDYGTTGCANNDYSSTCGGGSANDVVYRLNIGAGYPCTNVVASLCGSNFDTQLSVRTGGACPGSTQVVCDDDGVCGGLSSLQSNAVFTVNPGQDYFIIVDGFSANSGTYKLHVETSCQPESLVVMRSGNDIYLDWAPPYGANNGLLTYNVYRSTDPSVPVIPGNLIANTSSAYFTDVNRVSDVTTTSFYAVAVTVTALNLENPGGLTKLTQAEMKKAPTQEQLDAVRANIIPVYIDSANIQGPNPDKHAEAVQDNQHNTMPMNPYPQNNNTPVQPK
jgi:hypothetical protein